MAGHVLVWEVVARYSLLSSSSLRVVRSCRATRDRVGPNAGRPRRAGHRIRVASEWRKTTQSAACRGARFPAAAGAALGQVFAAGPSWPVRPSEHHRRAGGWDQKQKLHYAGASGRTEIFDKSPFDRVYIRGSSDLYTLLVLNRS